MNLLDNIDDIPHEVLSPTRVVSTSHSQPHREAPVSLLDIDLDALEVCGEEDLISWDVIEQDEEPVLVSDPGSVELIEL